MNTAFFQSHQLQQQQQYMLKQEEFCDHLVSPTSHSDEYESGRYRSPPVNLSYHHDTPPSAAFHYSASMPINMITKQQQQQHHHHQPHAQPVHIVQSNSYTSSSFPTSVPTELGLIGGGAYTDDIYRGNDLSTAEKRRKRRESHNAVERRRRDNINDKIQELGSLVPEDPNATVTGIMHKPNKGLILKRSVDYVRQVNIGMRRLDERTKELESVILLISRERGINLEEFGNRLSYPIGVSLESVIGCTIGGVAEMSPEQLAFGDQMDLEQHHANEVINDF